MKIAIGNDHAGVALKHEIKELLQAHGHEVVNCGTDAAGISVDYPDYASEVANLIVTKDVDLGIVICGTGIGISIAANKHEGIRCALCHDCLSAQLTREHNDSNMLALGARIIGVDLAKAIVKAFIGAEFEGGRHQVRIDKMMQIGK